MEPMEPYVTTGTSNVNYSYNPITLQVERVPSYDELKAELDALKNEEHHCPCRECAGREEIINKIWEEYSMIKDAAKWFHDHLREGEKEVIEYLPGSDPVLMLLLLYRDRNKQLDHLM